MCKCAQVCMNVCLNASAQNVVSTYTILSKQNFVPYKVSSLADEHAHKDYFQSTPKTLSKVI